MYAPRLHKNTDTRQPLSAIVAVEEFWRHPQQARRDGTRLPGRRGPLLLAPHFFPVRRTTTTSAPAKATCGLLAHQPVLLQHGFHLVNEGPSSDGVLQHLAQRAGYRHVQFLGQLVQIRVLGLGDADGDEVGLGLGNGHREAPPVMGNPRTLVSRGSRPGRPVANPYT